MRQVATAWLAVLLASSVAAPQQGLPKFVKSSKVPGIDVRFVDFGWNPEAFAAMESGGGHLAAGRSWMLALLRLAEPMKWEGRTVGVGASVLILHPKSGETPMSFEVRDIDLRDVYFQLDVIAPPPKGATIQKVPAKFETVAERKERLDVAVAAAGRDARLTIHYGNRKATLKLMGRE